MNLVRFVGKLVTDRPAACKSIKLIVRGAYGKLYWKLKPNQPLKVHLRRGGFLLLEPGHSFTGCLWPAVDDYEPDVCAALSFFLKPGATFVDCGANVGYFSIRAGQIVGPSGRVISIEANPITFALLQRNLEANGFGTAVNLALASEEGEIDLYVPRAGDIFSTARLGGIVKVSDAKSVKVKAQTLPAILSSLGVHQVDFVKIDIEGGELEVLESSRYLLKTQRPTVICEYGTSTWPAFGATKEQLLHLLDDCGYRVGVFDSDHDTVISAPTSVWNSNYANLILQPDGH